MLNVLRYCCENLSRPYFTPKSKEIIKQVFFIKIQLFKIQLKLCSYQILITVMQKMYKLLVFLKNKQTNTHYQCILLLVFFLSYCNIVTFESLFVIKNNGTFQ